MTTCIVCGQPTRGPLEGYWVFCTRCICYMAWSDEDTEAFVRMDTGLGLSFDFTGPLPEPIKLPVPPGVYV